HLPSHRHGRRRPQGRRSRDRRRRIDRRRRRRHRPGPRRPARLRHEHLRHVPRRRLREQTGRRGHLRRRGIASVTANRDTPGVIAPPPLIYIGFLLVGWAIFRFANPEVLGEAARWLKLGFGLETQTRRIVSLPLIIGGLLLDGAAAGYFRRLGTAVEPWKPSTVLAVDGL